MEAQVTVVWGEGGGVQVHESLSYYGESHNASAAKSLFQSIARFRDIFDAEVKRQQVVGRCGR